MILLESKFVMHAIGKLTKFVNFQVIDDERAWLQRVRREVESQAKKMLIQGLENLVGFAIGRGYLSHLQNPTHVGVALQVFYNLGQLEATLLTVLISYREVVQHEIQNAVDPTSLLQSSSSTL